MSDLDPCTLTSVLDGGEIEKMFTSFCAARLCLENLQFYQRAVAFRQLLGFKQRPLRKSGAGKDRAERAERREEREKRAQQGEAKKEQQQSTPKPASNDATITMTLSSTSGDSLTASTERETSENVAEPAKEKKLQASDSKGAILPSSAGSHSLALVVSTGEEHERETRRLAQEIFDEFLGPDSETPINVPAHIVKGTTESILRVTDFV